MPDNLIEDQQVELVEATVVKPNKRAFAVTSWLATLDIISRISREIPLSAMNEDFLSLCYLLDRSGGDTFLPELSAIAINDRHPLHHLFASSPFFSKTPFARHAVNQDLVTATKLYQGHEPTIARVEADGMGELIKYVPFMTDFYAERIIGLHSKHGSRKRPAPDMAALVIQSYRNIRYYTEDYYSTDTQSLNDGFTG